MTPKDYKLLLIAGSLIFILTVLIGLATIDKLAQTNQTIGNALAERRIHQVHP